MLIRSRIRSVCVRQYQKRYPVILQAGKQGPDQIAQICEESFFFGPCACFIIVLAIISSKWNPPLDLRTYSS